MSGNVTAVAEEVPITQQAAGLPQNHGTSMAAMLLLLLRASTCCCCSGQAPRREHSSTDSNSRRAAAAREPLARLPAVLCFLRVGFLLPVIFGISNGRGSNLFVRSIQMAVMHGTHTLVWQHTAGSTAARTATALRRTQPQDGCHSLTAR